MGKNTKIADYLLYLAYITKKLDDFFGQQSPYIFCKKGCSKCCENGEYPFSKLEFDFIMLGFSKLPPETREEIILKVKKIKEEKEKFLNCHSEAKSYEILSKIPPSALLTPPFDKGGNIQNDVLAEESQKKILLKSEFTYECPFLINHECSVYEYRGIICRSFGLMSINPEGLSKIPFCAFEGLNYSNVVEPDTKIVSLEKYKKLGENIPEPLAFNVGYKFLTSKKIEENFKINFGDKKTLIDWF